jgi:hypothetical protein
MKFIDFNAEGEPLIDPDGMEATAEYYIVRVYRRWRGQDGEPSSMMGVVEDTEGHRQPFQDREELWKGLSEKLGQDQ